jgi:hypothetical protein
MGKVNFGSKIVLNSRREVVLFSLLLVGCGVAESDNKGLEDLNRIEAKWKDSLRVASSTSRIALSGPVLRLQDIKRELEIISVSSCLKSAKGHLLEHMEISISALLLFMQKSDSASKESLLGAEQSLWKYKRGITLCSDKAPTGGFKVDPASPLAQNLKYTIKSSNPDRRCGNCVLYQGEGRPYGPCPIFQGDQVSSEGLCQAWVKRT